MFKDVIICILRMNKDMLLCKIAGYDVTFGLGLE